MRRFVVAVRLWAAHAAFSDVWQVPPILVEVLFVPLLATWSVCVGMAVSVRSTDVRVAQQLSTLASLPPLGLAILITFRVITPTVLSADRDRPRLRRARLPRLLGRRDDARPRAPDRRSARAAPRETAHRLTGRAR